MDERNTYPTWNGTSSDASATPITFSMIEKAWKNLIDPELWRQREEQRYRAENELNLRVKTRWAQYLGKSVEDLTSEDMSALSKALFHSWLKYKGVTEEEFRDWIGI